MNPESTAVDYNNHTNYATYVRNSICATCLSIGRKMYPVKDIKHLPTVTRVIELTVKDMVCWECKAIMGKMTSFRLQALEAKRMLNNVILQKKPKLIVLQTLSQLSIKSTEVNQLCTADDGSEVYQDTNKYQDNIPDEEDSTEVANETDVEANIKSEIDISDNFKHEADGDDGTDNNEDDGNDELKEDESTTNQHPELSMIYTKTVVNEKEMLTAREERRTSKRYIESKFKCEMCVEVYSKEEIWLEHKKKHEAAMGPYSCGVCELRFTSSDELDTHYNIHFIQYKCRSCDFHAERFDAVREHHHITHVKKACKHCHEHFDTEPEYRRHRRKEHARRATCEQCGKVFSSDYNLKRHMMIHKGLPLLECKVCHKQLRGERGLKVHMRTHSTKVDEAAFCAECGVQFKNVYLYRAHLKNTLKHVAVEDLRYKCQHCGKRFQFRTHLRCHIESIHTNTQNYVCDTCSQTFSTSIRLRVHVREKHEGKLRPKDKICDICAKAFRNKSTLQQHINSHVGLRPHACTTCGATFSYSGALYTHVKLKHRKLKRQARVKAEGV